MISLILLAPPAAGKGTLSHLLEEEYHLEHISTGDLLREEIKKETPLGKQIKSVIDEGAFVSDDVIIRLIEQKLTSPSCKNGYILDGFPRNIAQAQAYDALLKKLHLSLGKVLLLEADKDLLEKRTVGRRICENCGAIYNIYVKESMPKEENICDRCHGPLIKRKDDSIAVFQARYQTYLEKTHPLIDYYRGKGVLYTIDATTGKDQMLVYAKKIIDCE